MLFAILAVSAVTVFAGAFVDSHNHKHEEGIAMNMRCTFCRGTGFNGNFACMHCDRGRNSSY